MLLNEREGFALLRDQTDVTNFADEEQIRRIYYPEVVRLVGQATGAAEVLVFDHTLRLENNTAEGGRTPVRLAHNDYTERSGPQRVRDLLGSEAAEAALRGRVAQVNLWRPIRGPVESAPLAIVDAQSLPAKDLIATDLVFPDRVGEIYQVAHSPGQRWYSYPAMTPDEALLIKGYDSASDGRADSRTCTASPTAKQRLDHGPGLCPRRCDSNGSCGYPGRRRRRSWWTGPPGARRPSPRRRPSGWWSAGAGRHTRPAA